MSCHPREYGDPALVKYLDSCLRRNETSLNESMKIAILSRKTSLYSTSRLAEAAKSRGHEVKIIDHLRCYMNITSRSPSIHYKGRELEKFDAIIPRIGASVTFYGAAIVRQFEMMGVYSANESVSIHRSRDKLRSQQLLAREGIGLPVTSFGHSPDDIEDLIKVVGGPPLIVKLIEGTQGVGVVLCDTYQAAKSVIQSFRNLKAHFLVQEYIQEAKGSDLRCFVIGDQVVGAVIRQGQEGEFRSNLHRGGKALPVEITEDERQTAIKAAQTLGLNIAGVDILRSKHGPLVIEVNSSPGLKGIETCTGQNIAGMIIEFIEREAAPHKTKTRGRG